MECAALRVDRAVLLPERFSLAGTSSLANLLHLLCCCPDIIHAEVELHDLTKVLRLAPQLKSVDLTCSRGAEASIDCPVSCEDALCIPSCVRDLLFLGDCVSSGLAFSSTTNGHESKQGVCIRI